MLDLFIVCMVKRACIYMYLCGWSRRGHISGKFAPPKDGGEVNFLRSPRKSSEIVECYLSGRQCNGCQSAEVTTWKMKVKVVPSIQQQPHHLISLHLGKQLQVSDHPEGLP